MMKRRVRMFFYTFFSGILFDTILSNGSLLTGVHRICLSDLETHRKYELDGAFTSYANDSGTSEAECAQKCIERLELCSATKFDPDKKICFFSKQSMECEDLDDLKTGPTTSTQHILHCISCKGVLPAVNGSVESDHISSMVFRAGEIIKEPVERFVQTSPTQPDIRSGFTRSERNRPKSPVNAVQLQPRFKTSRILPPRLSRPHPGIFVRKGAQLGFSRGHIPRANILSKVPGDFEQQSSSPNRSPTQSPLSAEKNAEADNEEEKKEAAKFKTGQPLFPSDSTSISGSPDPIFGFIDDLAEVTQEELYPDVEDNLGSSPNFPPPHPLSQPPLRSATPPFFTTPKPIFVTWKPHSFLLTSKPNSARGMASQSSHHQAPSSRQRGKDFERRSETAANTVVKPTITRSKTYPVKAINDANPRLSTETKKSLKPALKEINEKDRANKIGSNLKLVPDSNTFHFIEPSASSQPLFPSSLAHPIPRSAKKSRIHKEENSLPTEPETSGIIQIEPNEFGNKFQSIPNRNRLETRRPHSLRNHSKRLGKEFLNPAPSLLIPGVNERSQSLTRRPPGQPKFLWNPGFAPGAKTSSRQPQAESRSGESGPNKNFGEKSPLALPPQRKPPSWGSSGPPTLPLSVQNSYQPPRKQPSRPIGTLLGRGSTFRNGQRARSNSQNQRSYYREGGQVPGSVNTFTRQGLFPGPEIIPPTKPGLSTLFPQGRQQHARISQLEKARRHFGIGQNSRFPPGTASALQKTNPKGRSHQLPPPKGATLFGNSPGFPNLSANRQSPVHHSSTQRPINQGSTSSPSDAKWESVKNVPLFPSQSAHPTGLPTQSGLPQLLGESPWDRNDITGVYPTTPHPFAHLQASASHDIHGNSEIQPPLDLETFLALQPAFAWPWWRPTTPPTLIILPDTAKTKSSAEATLSPPGSKIFLFDTTTSIPTVPPPDPAGRKKESDGGSHGNWAKALFFEEKEKHTGKEESGGEIDFVAEVSRESSNGSVINIAVANPKIHISGVGNFFPGKSSISLDQETRGLPPFNFSLVSSESSENNQPAFKIISFSRSNDKQLNHDSRKEVKSSEGSFLGSPAQRKENDQHREKNQNFQSMPGRENEDTNQVKPFQPSLFIPHDWPLLRDKAREWQKEAERGEVHKSTLEEESRSTVLSPVLNSAVEKTHDKDKPKNESDLGVDKDSSDLDQEDSRFIRIISGPVTSNLKSNANRSKVHDATGNEENSPSMESIAGPILENLLESIENVTRGPDTDSIPSETKNWNALPIAVFSQQDNADRPYPFDKEGNRRTMHHDVFRDAENNFDRKKSGFQHASKQSRTMKNGFFIFHFGKQSESRSPKYWMEEKIKALSSRVSTKSNAHLMNETCVLNKVTPCIFGFGQGCSLELDAQGCRLCTCPDGTPAKGCSGPQGLTEKMRKDYLLQRRRCPDGRRAQMVHRFQRERFGGCVIRKQPYCGWLTDVEWRMPRTRKECREFCYGDLNNLA